MRWALLLFKYFRCMSGLSHSCCRWPESKTIVRSKRSLDFVRSRFSRAHPLEPELLSAVRHLSCLTWNVFFEATDLHRAVIFNLFCTANPQSIVTTHYTNDPHLKLDQTKCNTAVCIKNLLETPPKMFHDPSGQCSVRKMYTKQMFVLVRMQLRNHVNRLRQQSVSSVTEDMRYIYDIKSGLLLARVNEISLHWWSVGTAHLPP